MENNGGNGGDNGVGVLQKHRLVLVYDTATHQVSIEGDALPLSLAQMMLDEAARVLTETRRRAAAMQIAAQMQEQARAQGIVDAVGRNLRGN